MVNSSKEWILLQFKRWSQIAPSFDGLVFLNVKGDIPICSPDLTFKCLSVSPQLVELHLPHVYLYTTQDTKSKGKRSLKRKAFESFLWLLKTI